MRFELSGDQRDFAGAVEGLLAGADTIGAARAWAEGDTAPGVLVWEKLADLGVHALLVPEAAGGVDATPVEMAIALEAVGRHALPGPWAESVAFLPTALDDETVLGELAGGGIGSVAVAPTVPYALDADIASHLFVVADGALQRAAVEGDARTSVDRTRRLFAVRGEASAASSGLERAYDLAVLATAAQLLGAGERVLADTVAYAKQRRQFGREIGSYQAVKHQLADVRIALDFARPLLFGAALDPTPRSVSAAKVACGDAAYLASRTGLQVHGAIGYTSEFDLSVWITRVRALVGAWGTASHHRDRVLTSLVGEG